MKVDINKLQEALDYIKLINSVDLDKIDWGTTDFPAVSVSDFKFIGLSNVSFAELNNIVDGSKFSITTMTIGDL
jgi:hypothetical protein